MSYDLTFLAKKSKTLPTTDDLVRFLAPRLDYRGEGSEIWYENQETGVYFSLGLGANPPTEEDITEPIRNAGFQWTGLSFNMNYFRPSVFGLEAATELDALVKEFDFVVDDPQNDGMGLGAFSKAAFIRGWNAGNSFAISAMKTQEGEELVNRVQLLPSAEIKAIWEWNYNRRELQKEIGPEIYVAKITTMRMNGSFGTLAVWSDAIPTIFPVVDYLGLYRQELAPKRFLRDPKPDMHFLKLTDVDNVLKLPKLDKSKKFSRPAYVLSSTGPKEVDFFRQLKNGLSDYSALSFDSIMDKEVFEAAKVLKVAYRSDA